MNNMLKKIKKWLTNSDVETVVFEQRRINAKIPYRTSKKAGGWDVTVCKIEREEDVVICYLGFALKPPTGYKVTLVPRSSITKTKWIMQNSPGLGDEDFHGEYQMRFRALPHKWKTNVNYTKGEAVNELTYLEFPYKEGDRVGQMYLEKVIPIEFVDGVIEKTERQEGGFGSSGK